MKSLAGVAPYLHGVGVAVNREMYAWEGHHENDTPLCKAEITAWNGYMFCEGNITYKHACEVETDENSFVRDGVRYVAVEQHNHSCEGCDVCGEFCLSVPAPCTTKIWKRADTKTRPMTYEERVEALERKLEKVG